MRCVLCLVTDRVRLAARLGRPVNGVDDIDLLVAHARAAAAAGVDFIQVREPDLGAGAVWTLVGRIIEAVRPAKARVLVSDRLDVALACGADGVHLKEASIPPQAARRLAPAGFLIGRSVHGVEAVRHAVDGGADYLVFGTVFATGSKAPGVPLAGPAGLEAAVGAAGRVPVLAIGGAGRDTAPVLRAAGAAGMAAIDAFLPRGADLDTELHTIVADLRTAFDTPSPLT